MKRKIFGMGIMMLFIATAVLPAVGTINKSIAFTTTNNSQPMVEWKKTFDRGEFDHFHTARQTADGGYIACGTTEENNMFYVWLVKLDVNGNEAWRVVNYDLNGSVLSNLNLAIGGLDVHQTSDGGYIICGDSWIPYDFHGQTFGESNMFLWKTDTTGKTQWSKHYYDQSEQYMRGYMCYNIIEVENGFVASGHMFTGDPISYTWNQSGCLMKFDSLGVKQWVREFEKGGNDSLPSVYKTSDGGYFLSGFTDTATTNEGALWMVKTDNDGNKQWESLFDGPGFEYTYGKGGFQTSDGGYIMDGVTGSYGHGSFDTWLIKADSSGTLQWDNTFGGTRSDYCWGMCKADNDGFALGVCINYGYNSGTKDDILVVETDKDGNAEWQFQIEDDGIQVTRSINPTSDGGYIIAAMTGNFGYTRTDGVLVKIASFDNQQPTKPEISGPAKGKPDKNYTFTASSTDPDGGAISYRWDWGDGNYSEWLATSEATYSWTYEDNFEVRVMAQDENGGESVWSDPLPFSTPDSYNPMLEFLELLFQRFSNAFPLLRQILGY